MPQPRALILRAPGTNCDLESEFAFQQGGAAAQSIHIRQLLERPRQLADFQILCLPGGFSYGDDLGAGRILGNQIAHHLADCLHDFREAGKLILAICNGFQVLIKSGLLLPDDPQRGALATLTTNASGKFEDRWVQLRVAGSKCVFFRGMETIYLPVAHAEGRFVTRDRQVLEQLDAAGQLVLRYARLDGGVNGAVPYPDNPNGAQADVAGMCDATGRVCGLMPHPERHIDPTHHPRWTRHQGALPEFGEGLAVFKNAAAYFN
jgi:phosphoribosylformylglycinamidine synthase